MLIGEVGFSLPPSSKTLPPREGPVPGGSQCLCRRAIGRTSGHPGACLSLADPVMGDNVLMQVGISDLHYTQKYPT